MANTPGLQQLRGRVAGFVYRLRNGKQTLSQAPDLSRVAWSPAQGEHRQRFGRGVAYARAAMEEAIPLGGEPAVMFEYECPSSHDSFGLVALSIHNNKGYWLTWIAPQGNAEADKAEFTEILSTFSFAE